MLGEIRTPIEYLVKLLETEAFQRNTIDTSWLDGLLRERKDDGASNAQEVVLAAVARPPLSRGLWPLELG